MYSSTCLGKLTLFSLYFHRFIPPRRHEPEAASYHGSPLTPRRCRRPKPRSVKSRGPRSIVPRSGRVLFQSTPLSHKKIPTDSRCTGIHNLCAIKGNQRDHIIYLYKFYLRHFYTMEVHRVVALRSELKVSPLTARVRE